MKNRSLLKITVLLFFVVFSLQSSPALTIPTPQIQQDSIAIWIKASRKKNYSPLQKKVFLLKAYNQENLNPSPKNLSIIAFRYYQLKDTLRFNIINKETLNLAMRIKDSFYIADAHWNYATFFLNGEIYDKAYQHFTIAYDYFNNIHKKYEAARMLYSMAFIKGRYKDYTGSEVLTIKALEIFKSLKDYEYIYSCYNNLALLQNDIQEYEKALFYHKKASQQIEKINTQNNYLAWNLNNIGNTYLKSKNFKRAIPYFNKALSKNTDEGHLARIIDNRAYCKLMLGDTSFVKKDMLKALKIRDSTKNKAGIVYSKIRLSKYYSYIKDTSTAFRYAKEANLLANEVKNGVDYLESLDLMANLDPQHSKKYLRRYIQYNDSLIAVERKVQNNFTRIDFETDEYIEETKRLSQQKVWISITGIGITLILSLLYFLKVQKSKTEKLVLETEQQKANEQVYLLTLQQQSLLEEEKAQERNRISEELHDGILSRLFGTRVGLGFLDLSADEATQQQRQSFLEELQEIEKEIRDVSHQLNNDFTSAEINFTSIINQLLKDKSGIGQFKSDLTIDKSVSWKKINEVIKVNVYRIIQESLQNIVKHANAKNVHVTFSINEEHLVLQIKDDGNGFNYNKKSKGIGIKNMKARVQKMKGKLQVHSEISKGTSIHINIPLV